MNWDVKFGETIVHVTLNKDIYNLLKKNGLCVRKYTNTSGISPYKYGLFRDRKAAFDDCTLFSDY